MLREGNSDRRAPGSVKQYARNHPHSMGAWIADSKTNVAHMTADDFRSTEKSAVDRARTARSGSSWSATTARTTVLRESVPVLAGEVVDATVMRVAALREFLTAQIARAKADDVLFSVHLKATMMKVSDPIIFGHVVRAFFPNMFAQYGDALAAAGLTPNDGLGGILTGPRRARRRAAEIKAAFEQGLADGPALAMVDSDKGITNLHVPSDVIVDASMPAMIRTSGHMWGPDGEEARHPRGHPGQQLRRHLPGRHRRLPRQRRLRPGDHGLGPQRRPDGAGGRGVRLATTRPSRSRPPARSGSSTRPARRCSSTPVGGRRHLADVPDQGRPDPDWVKLAVTRARATGAPAVFWLDEGRAHDANLIAKVEPYLAEHDTEGLDIQILAPVDAIAFSLERIRRGEDTISVTGNVLRDYLTDLFPILELGTSAKMLSVVPLINGGGLFETGAGGSAPKHVQQLVKENYLRWDSLGEFLALAVELRAPGADRPATRAPRCSPTRSTGRPATFLNENKSPARRVGGIDNRGSHFYLALYWAQELAAQTDDADLAKAFADARRDAAAEEATIIDELLAVQGSPADIGGYYRPDDAKAAAVMRPSPTLKRRSASLAQ